MREVNSIPDWVIPLLLIILILAVASFCVIVRINRLNRRLQLEIDERREAERALESAQGEKEAAHQKLVAISEALPVAMFQIEAGPDATPRFTFLSRRAEEFLGVPYEELLADPKQVWRNVHPDDAKVVSPLRSVVMYGQKGDQCGGCVEHTSRIRQGDEVRWLLSCAHAAPPRPDGTVVWNGFFQDISSQKQDEALIQTTNEQLAERSAELAQALRNASSRLEGILENSPAAIWAKDRQGVYLFANHAYRSMFNVGDGEIEGCTDDDFFPPDTAAGFRENDLKVISEAKTASFTEKVGLPNGVEFVLSVKFPLFDQDGVAYAAAGMCLDITEQLRLQEQLKALNEELEERVTHRTAELSRAYDALRESEARLSKTTENAPCLIFQFMLRPDGSAYFPYVSEFSRAYFGVEPKDVKEDATPILSLFHPEDVPGYLAAIDEAVANHTVFKHDWRIRFPDGRITWARAISRPEFFENGEILWNGVLMDITELKHVEEALRHSQTQLQGIIDHSPAVIFMKDLEGRYILGNRRWEEVVGTPVSSALGRTDLELFSTENADHWGEHDRAVWESGQPFTTNELLRRDDETLYFLSSRFPLLDGDGKPLSLCGIAVDITETKRAEEALRERETEFRTLVSNLPGVVYRCRAGGDWKMYFISDEMERLTGYPAADFMGDAPRSLADVIHPDDRELRQAVLLDSVEEGRSYALEYRMIHRDGHLLWVSCMGQAVRDEQGNAVFFIGSLFDVTQRKMAEQALLESQLRVDLAAEAAELSFADHDLRTGMVWVRGHVARLAGAHDVLEVPYTELDERIIPEDRERAVAEREAALTSAEGDYCLEYRVRDFEDGVHWLETRGKIIRDADSNPVRISALLLDTTQRKCFEEELRAARLAADESNKAKGDFLANMSHEIRTPMNAVLGMTQLALQTDLDERQRNYLRKIDVAARNLLGIINDILDFSKIEAGKLQVEVVDFNLDLVLQNVADMFTAKAQEQGIEFLFRWEPGVPALLTGDPLRIGQILINLASNAFKFTESGEVEVGVEKTDETAESVTLRFSVRDTGIGLTQAQQERLFQAFSQADTSTTRKYGGTGLGLIICKRLVEMMGGQIWLESEAGVGTTFYFTTVLGKPVLGPTHGSWEVGELAGSRVLVVDDNATSREILTGILSSFQFEVVPASAGEEALEILRAQSTRPFDLVLMDWQMPGMDGIEVARRIRGDAQMPYVPPIVMVSAYGREELMKQAAKIGISGFLIKPVNPSLLLDTIIQVFGKGGVLAASEISEAKDEAPNLAGLRVLVVEDNEINREVALELLGGAGMDVTMANDGEQGVAAVRSAADAGQLYDAVLMDCQMPVLDGYEATKLLRQEARFENLPIVAMTANAMAGDREKCLAAGMNEHVTKPIEISKLFSTLAQLTAREAVAGISKPKTITGSQSGHHWLEEPDADSHAFDFTLPGVDIASGLNRMQGNRDLYRRILGKFWEGQKDVVVRILAAQEAGDQELAVRLAHTLKGVAGNIGAQELFDAAGTLEHSLKEEPEGDITSKLEAVGVHLEPLLAAIAALEGSDAPKEDGASTTQHSDSEIDLVAIEPTLEKIEALLARSNTKARVALQELRILLLGTSYEAAVGEILSAVGDYNFNAARDGWGQLMANLGEIRGRK